jgi:hypothetical protein
MLPLAPSSRAVSASSRQDLRHRQIDERPGLRQLSDNSSTVSNMRASFRGKRLSVGRSISRHGKSVKADLHQYQILARYKGGRTRKPSTVHLSLRTALPCLGLWMRPPMRNMNGRSLFGCTWWQGPERDANWPPTAFLFSLGVWQGEAAW